MILAPRVFVVTLNWNGKKWLEDCFTSVLALDYENFQVVMADNGSTDGSVEFVRQKFPAVQIVETGGNLGYARGLNVGLEYAAARGAEFFLIMNNDTVIDREALGALV
ncbi:MAG: glycosyltransferase, partial [Anaerolineales bacterium]|nr:glycosyltransferase [Anaerolineales bacterium]